jgi:hypothetical protein
MNLRKLIFLGILSIFFTIIDDCFCQNNHVLRIQSIPQSYKQPQIDIHEENSLGIFSGSCWTVLSTCDQNITYADPEGKTQKTKVSFLELLFVENEKGEFLHVYSDPAPDIENAILSSAAVDKGWIRKTTVLMWKHCLLTPVSKQNIQVMTCQYNDILDMETSGGENNGGITVYSDPDLRKQTPLKTKAKELYYAFKIEANAILIGNANRMPFGTPPSQTIIGWIPRNYCYRLDTRIWIARNNKPEAIDEMLKNRILPCLIFDEQQARIFCTTQKCNSNYIDRQWDPGKNDSKWFPFPLVNEKEGVFKVKVVDNDFKTAYAPSKIKGMENPLFRKVTLISATDLNNVIANMSGMIEFSGGISGRDGIRKFLAGKYQEEYPDLKEEMIYNLTIRQVFESLFWILNSSDPVLDLKLRRINDPEMFSNSTLIAILSSMASSVKELRRVADYLQEDKDLTFESNEIRYFWVDSNLFY